MTQNERRLYLIKALIGEQPKYRNTIEIPQNETQQKQLLRSLFNVRMPSPISEDFLKVQDDYPKEETAQKGITRLSDLLPIEDNIYLWQGDITTLECGAIVNAANSGMTGCYVPCHNCIDNCIHTFSGIQLRNECDRIMQEQDFPPLQALHTAVSVLKNTFPITELIPKCPVCGKPMTMNLRSDDSFVEDEGWHKAAKRYADFIDTRKGKILFIELGVGFNTPSIIKYPFWRMTKNNSQATYACINFGDAGCPAEIREQSICIDGDIGEVINKLT